MAYIPGYTYDIFISYAHLDNEKMPGQMDGWIELFYKSLNLKLAQRIGKMDAVKIWWDSKKLDGSKLFDNSIEDGIRNSAIMISLVSPGYLQSEYCRKEMDLFCSKSTAEKTGLSVGDNSRIIKVLLNNIPHTQLPEQFGRATGFPFYLAEDNDDFGDPLNASHPSYAEQLKALRDSLVKMFELFPKQPNVSEAEIINVLTDSDSKEDKFTLFFGEVSDSLRSTRKRSITELENTGYTILTGVPPPEESTAHDKKITEVLKKADLAVHLLDQFPGRDIEGTDTWFPKRQAELSLELAPAKMLWVPAELDLEEVEEETYKSFLSKIESGNSSEKTFEYVKGNKSEISKQILDYANAIKQSRVRAESDQKISVLLDTHFSDQQYAFSLGQAIFQNNMQPYINPQEDDPRKNMNLLADRISQVNKLVFLYGSVSREWVLERMSAALQLIVTHNFPIDDFYVYLAPPNKPNDDIKLNQRFLKINVLNNSAQNTVNAELIDNFIKNLKGNAA
jgi:hypothetical protein